MIQAKFPLAGLRKIWRMSTNKLNTEFDVVDIKNSHLLYVKDP